jgi:hypothetical protein
MSTTYHFELEEHMVPGTTIAFFYEAPHSKTHSIVQRFDDYCVGTEQYTGKYRLTYHPRNEEYNLKMCILGYLKRQGYTVNPYTLRLGSLPK